jgi:hypothetical protein
MQSTATPRPDPIMNIEESRISHRVRYAEIVWHGRDGATAMAGLPARSLR